MTDELKTLKEIELNNVLVLGHETQFAYSSTLRAEAILKVKRIRNLLSQVGHNQWCPSFYGEKDGLQRYGTLKTLERYIIWQNNLKEDDLR